MNWKAKLALFLTFLFVFLISVNWLKLQNKTKELKLVDSETSPDGTKKILLYETPFNGSNQLDYQNYLSNKYIFAVKELNSGRERYVFVNDYKTGNPHWLGNEHIFFTGGCGTGCRGLYLVNINSKESHPGVLTVTPITKNSFETNFRDWFGQEFKFPGGPKQIKSVLVENKTYLVFQMENNGQSIGEKKFLFSKNRLEEQY